MVCVLKMSLSETLILLISIGIEVPKSKLPDSQHLDGCPLVLGQGRLSYRVIQRLAVSAVIDGEHSLLSFNYPDITTKGGICDNVD